MNLSGKLNCNNMPRGRKKIYTDDELREHKNAYSRKHHREHKEKYNAYARAYVAKRRKKRYCLYCKARIDGTRQQKVCNNGKCYRKLRKDYFKKYSEKNPEKVTQWRKIGSRNSYKKYIENRPLRRCKVCSDLIGDGMDYSKALCDSCRDEGLRNANKRYYEKNRDKEVARKAKWFQENKRAIVIRSRTRALLRKLETLSKQNERPYMESKIQ